MPAELIKPKAYCVLREPRSAGPELERELVAFVKQRLAPFKYPRWIEFIDELPKTASGKVQRFRLRNMKPGGGRDRRQAVGRPFETRPTGPTKAATTGYNVVPRNGTVTRREPGDGGCNGVSG